MYLAKHVLWLNLLRTYEANFRDRLSERFFCLPLDWESNISTEKVSIVGSMVLLKGLQGTIHIRRLALIYLDFHESTSVGIHVGIVNRGTQYTTPGEYVTSSYANRG